MVGNAERTLVRILVTLALCAALVTSALVPVPEDLPSIALRQAGLYRLEIALLVFYGGLLLITPAFVGLTRGRLPTEISTRGARFAEEADQSAELTKTAVKGLEQNVSFLTERLSEVMSELDQMKNEVTGRDRH